MSCSCTVSVEGLNPFRCWNKKLHANYLQLLSDDIFMWCEESSGRRSCTRSPYGDVRGKTQARPAQRGQSVPLTAVVFLRVWITHVVFSSRICRTYCKVIVLLSAFIPSSHIFMFATHHVSNCVLGGTVRVCIYVSLTHPHVSPSGPAGLNFWGVLSQLSERLLVFFFPCKNTR